MKACLSNPPGGCAAILSTWAAPAWLATWLAGPTAAACASATLAWAGACCFDCAAAPCTRPFTAWKFGSVSGEGAVLTPAGPSASAVAGASTAFAGAGPAWGAFPLAAAGACGEPISDPSAPPRPATAPPIIGAGPPVAVRGSVSTDSPAASAGATALSLRGAGASALCGMAPEASAGFGASPPCGSSRARVASITSAIAALPANFCR